MDGAYVLCVLWTEPQFLPQRTDGIGDAHNTVLPAHTADPLIDVFPCEKQAGIAGHQVQNTKFRRREIHNLAPHRNELPHGIDGEVLEDNSAWGPFPAL